MFFSHPNILCLFSVWYVFSGLSPSEMTGGQIDRTRRPDGSQIDSQFSVKFISNFQGVSSSFWYKKYDFWAQLIQEAKKSPIFWRPNWNFWGQLLCQEAKFLKFGHEIAKMTTLYISPDFYSLYILNPEQNLFIFPLFFW